MTHFRQKRLPSNSRCTQHPSVQPHHAHNMPRLPASAGVTGEDAARFEAARAAGNEAYRAGRYADAVAHYTKAEECNPCSALAPANRALAWLKLHQFRKASDDCSVALALLDDFAPEPGTTQLRVKCLLRRAEARRGVSPPLLAAAARDYVDVLAIEPSNPRAQQALRELEHAGVRPERRDGNPPSNPGIDVVSTTSNDTPQNRVSEQEPSSLNGNGRTRETEGLVRDFPLMRISDHAVDALTDNIASKPPRDATEFERVWRSLRGREEKRGTYLLLVGAARVRAGLLGHTLTPQLLAEITKALKALGGNVAACEFLTAITTLPRFNIAVMLMDPATKRTISEICDEQGNSNQTIRIRTAYEL